MFFLLMFLFLFFFVFVFSFFFFLFFFFLFGCSKSVFPASIASGFLPIFLFQKSICGAVLRGGTPLKPLSQFVFAFFSRFLSPLFFLVFFRCSKYVFSSLNCVTISCNLFWEKQFFEPSRERYFFEASFLIFSFFLSFFFRVLKV